MSGPLLAYLRFLKEPPALLVDTFRAEESVLRTLTRQRGDVLDLGCSAPRTLYALSQEARLIVAVDDSHTTLAQCRLALDGPIGFVRAHVSRLPFPERTFDLTYASYNFLGDMDILDHTAIVREMHRVTRYGGIVAAFSWKQDDVTSEFLREYGALSGISSAGRSLRFSPDQLCHYFSSARFADHDTFDAGPFLHGIWGRK